MPEDGRFKSMLCCCAALLCFRERKRTALKCEAPKYLEILRYDRERKHMPLCQLINLLFRFFFLFLFLNDTGICLWVVYAGPELLAFDVLPQPWRVTVDALTLPPSHSHRLSLVLKAVLKRQCTFWLLSKERQKGQAVTRQLSSVMFLFTLPRTEISIFQIQDNP